MYLSHATSNTRDKPFGRYIIIATNHQPSHCDGDPNAGRPSGRLSNGRFITLTTTRQSGDPDLEDQNRCGRGLCTALRT